MSTTPPPITTFPSTLKLQIELEITVQSPEDVAYCQNPDGTLQHGFIADLFDCLSNEIPVEEIKRINGHTLAELRKLFENDVTL